MSASDNVWNKGLRRKGSSGPMAESMAAALLFQLFQGALQHDQTLCVIEMVVWTISQVRLHILWCLNGLHLFMTALKLAGCSSW